MAEQTAKKSRTSTKTSTTKSANDEKNKDENLDYNLNFTFGKAQKRTVRAALSNSFGFGGHNATIIVKKFVK